MRIVFCWTDISGYMAACWRALARIEGVEVSVLAFAGGGPGFATDLMQGLDHELLDDSTRDDPARVAQMVSERRPDIVVIAGWMHPPYRRLSRHPALDHARFILAMDTPWRGDWRQRMARWRLWPLLRRMDRVVVPGERGWQYARNLGLPERRIERGLYGVDEARLRDCLSEREKRDESWPRRMVFVGRYAPEKGVDVLLDAYQRYRRAHREPFELSCCGKGPLGERLRGVEGVTDYGFVQPDSLSQTLSEHGVFVLPSRYDPWPLALVEACAAGLPVICTSACGSAVELIRPYHNGLVVPTADADALAHAMSWMHQHAQDLPRMGARAQPFAAAYSAQLWAQRWSQICRQLLDRADT